MSSDHCIYLQTLKGDQKFFISNEDGNDGILPKLALRWSAIVRNRRRWTDAESAYAEVMRQAEEDLARIELSDEAREALADAGVVQVGLPWLDGKTYWALRMLPWEFFLSAATKRIRRNEPLIVVRHLQLPERPAEPPDNVALVVISAPGPFGHLYSFAGERELVRNNLPGMVFRELWNPSIDQLEREIRERRPKVIHLTGLDSHQGAALLHMPRNRLRRDGVFFKGGDNRPNAVPAEELSQRLRQAGCSAEFIGFNCFYSSGWLGPLALSGGARTAIGFQDEIDDDVAEQFYADFYDAWDHLSEGCNPLAAFGVAFQMMRGRHASPRNVGVAFWSSVPLLHGWSPELVDALREVRGGKADNLSDMLAHCRAKQEPAEDKSHLRGGDDERRRRRTEPPRAEHIIVDIKPNPALNYALLHNNRPLFERFAIKAPGYKQPFKVDVEVGLQIGQDSIIYRRIHSIRESSDISDDIRIPLTWVHAHALNEGVRTSFLVKVLQDNQVFEARSFPVVLLPPDEWRDTDADRTLLPSFVFPRDPAIAQVIEAGQRYLFALTDTPTAGFDGYQALASDIAPADEGVDLQVRAIWSALVHDLSLNYINPPPSYGQDPAQRLRTPSQILNERRGTCIELALFVAACLEWVDIYPVVFLIKGHAMTGYWRDPKEHAAFFGPFGDAGTTNGLRFGDADAESAARAWPGVQREKVLQSEGWKVEDYDAVMALVASGQVVPLESVCLTERTGFATAKVEAEETLRLNNPNDFDAMLDVVRARRDPLHPATPLPLRKYQS